MPTRNRTPATLDRNSNFVHHSTEKVDSSPYTCKIQQTSIQYEKHQYFFLPGFSAAQIYSHRITSYYVHNPDKYSSDTNKVDNIFLKITGIRFLEGFLSSNFSQSILSSSLAKHIKDNVIGNSQHRFMKGKSCLN